MVVFALVAIVVADCEAVSGLVLLVVPMLMRVQEDPEVPKAPSQSLLHAAAAEADVGGCLAPPTGSEKSKEDETQRDESAAVRSSH